MYEVDVSFRLEKDVVVPGHHCSEVGKGDSSEEDQYSPDRIAYQIFEAVSLRR
jgi:hypothetical protein